MTIGFAQIACRRCSAIRIRGIACPDCGAAPDPREVDPKRQRRQRTVVDVLRLLDGASSSGPPIGFDVTGSGTFARAEQWLGRFMSALHVAVGPSGDVAALRDAADEFVRLRADVEALPRLRPWLVLVDTARAVIHALESVARGFLSAVAAETPLEAQETASRAQERLDNAADLLHDYTAQLARWQRAGDSTQLDELLPGLVREARHAANASDLLELDAAGAADFEDLTGEQCPPGFGVVLRMLSLVAEAVCDSERFSSVVADAYHHLASHTARLDRLLSAPMFKVDLSDALIKSIDSSQQTAILLNAALHPRQDVAAVLDTAHALFEGPGKRHAAALLSVASNRPYERLRGIDASALLHQARQAGMGAMLCGLDSGVRGARAHLTWAVDGEEVVFTNRDAVQRLSVPELIDHVLTAEESVLALTFALTCAAAARGVDDLVDSDFLREVGLTESGLIIMLASSFGLRDVVVEKPDHSGTVARWAVRGRADVDLKPMSLAAAVLACLPVTADLLALTIDMPTGRVHVQGPTDCWKTWREASIETAKERALIEACTVWRLNGNPLIDRDHVRQWTARKTLQAAQQGYPDAIVPIRDLHVMALRVGDSDLAVAVKAVITLLRRAAAMDDKQTPDGSQPLKPLTDWATANLGQWDRPGAISRDA